MTAVVPPGVARNNPFDIMYDRSIPWLGEIKPKSGRGLLAFDTAIRGIRAGMKDAHTKVYVDKLDTLETLISKFAPPNENDTAQYIANVREWLGMKPKQKLDLSTRDRLVAYAKAINRQEVGYKDEDTKTYWYTDSDYMTAATMVLPG